MAARRPLFLLAAAAAACGAYAAAAAAAGDLTGDRAALLAMYNSTGGRKWFDRAGWATTK